MTIDICYRSERTIGLAEFTELFRQGGFTARDTESLREAAPLLASLYNDRNFLAEIFLEEIEGNLAGQSGNFYGPHVVTLGNPDEFTLLRANIWPSETNEDYKRSPNSFIYGVPHDHNFNFLSVGYWGPGYTSQYYEYDYGRVVGFAGEDPELRPSVYKGLGLGDMMLYRAHQDVHCQFPPDEMSITINVMDVSPDYHFKDQYIFDQKASRISVVLSSRCSPNLFDIAVATGNENIFGLLESIAQGHASDYKRSCAIRSLLKSDVDTDVKRRLVDMVARSPSEALKASIAGLG